MILLLGLVVVAAADAAVFFSLVKLSKRLAPRWSPHLTEIDSRDRTS